MLSKRFNKGARHFAFAPAAPCKMQGSAWVGWYNAACDVIVIIVLAQAVSTCSLLLWGGAIAFTGRMLTTASGSSVKSMGHSVTPCVVTHLS